MNGIFEAANLGVGALFGVVVFVIYRIDRRKSEERLDGIIKEDVETRKANTSAITELTTLLKNMNGRR